MPRYFASITINELLKKTAPYNHGDLVSLLKSDLKVKFDLENSNSIRRDLLGFHTLPNGFTFLGIESGGDWEKAVFWLVYWDGKKLRGYIPTKGNPWNAITREAYGNDPDMDGMDAHKRYPKIYTTEEPLEEVDVERNYDLITKDIMERILPKITNHTLKVKPEKKSLETRVNELVYYGTADEGTELFQATCHLCYKMFGLSNDNKAETLYKWAKEMALDSKKFAEKEGSLDDFINGNWG